jgi:hypothetical protein
MGELGPAVMGWCASINEGAQNLAAVHDMLKKDNEHIVQAVSKNPKQVGGGRIAGSSPRRRHRACQPHPLPSRAARGRQFGVAVAGSSAASLPASARLCSWP